MQFYFIRHGQSENNLLWELTGSSDGRSIDPALTELGQQQAALVANYLSKSDPSLAPNGDDLQNVAGFGITHLYTSLMVRAVATGATIARTLGLPLVAWKDFHESGGMYRKDEVSGELLGQPGKTRAYFEAHYPELVLPQSVDEAGWWNRPFEAREERPVRARRVVQDLLGRHGNTDDRVAVVSHGGFFNHLMRAMLRLPADSDHWFVMHNAAITRIDFSVEHVTVVYVNRVDFLPPTLMT